MIRIDDDKKVFPKKFNLATAYAAGIANIKVIITVPTDTKELINIYLPKL
tara:strand:+ start:605 stop:754 length:150 start_codon:yes stop_codon:yes gene_type:complete